MACPVCGTETKNNTICGGQECRDFIGNLIDDPIFFFENALILRYIQGKPQFFELMPWQRRFLEYAKDCIDNNKPIRACVIKGRRIGFSTLMAGFHLWYAVCRAAADGEDKYWDIISASHGQAKKLFRTGRRMIRWNPLLLNAVRVEANGVLRLGETQVIFQNSGETIESMVTALSSGGATKRGRDPSGQTFDEAAQISDEDYNDLDISSMAGDDHQIIGSTPYDDFGFFYQIIDGIESGENTEFELFDVPTATLTPSGEALLNSGDLASLTEDHIDEVIGWRITKKKILNRLKRYDIVTAKREIFGKFVSGLELYYPSSLVKPCVDFERKNYDLIYNPMDVSNEVLKAFPLTKAILIGVDMAGRGHDKTVVTVFALQDDNSAHMIYAETWNRMKYTNQFDEIKRIYECFKNKKWSEPTIYVDITGTQDANLDSLEAMGLDVIGVDFTQKKKISMAKILFEYLMRGKESNGEFFSLIYDETMYKEMLSVKADLKGEKGHLGDWVASIWCALSELTDLSGQEEADYDFDAPMSESASLNYNF